MLPPGTFARLPVANNPCRRFKLRGATRQTLPVVALSLPPGMSARLPVAKTAVGA